MAFKQAQQSFKQAQQSFTAPKHGQTQDEGCAAYPGGKNKGGFLQCPSVVKGRCACTNCKYADHAGTIIIELDYE